MKKSLVFCVLIFVACAGRRMKLPSYDDFVSVQQKALQVPELEIYGKFAAAAQKKSVKASFNLLLAPGKNAYLEIIGPGQQMMNAFSLSGSGFTLLWAKDREYIQEESTPQNLQSITGFPVYADDLMLLMGGYGLNFTEWHSAKATKDGWTLEREPFTAHLMIKEQISKIEISSKTSPAVQIEYSDYQMMNNRLVPRSVHMSVPERKIDLRLGIEKLLPRDEPASADLFEVKLPSEARRLSLKEIYHGQPLIY